ncbi:MAG: cyanophycin synthetase [bacterium]|nr:cyanophycin synthetase [bacterium]
MAAIGACQVLGIDKNIVLKSIESFKPPLGRGNIVYDNSFKVMVDFAHTPNGIEQILKAVKPQVKGRIIHVFGSAGDRDKYKRPLMGKISSNYSDIIILTAEDPRKEPLINIIDEIASGVREIELKTNKKVLMKILDRQQAINKAVKLAQKGDLVLITGKGHEKSMNSGKGEVSWSEYKAIEEALEEKNV